MYSCCANLAGSNHAIRGGYDYPGYRIFVGTFLIFIFCLNSDHKIFIAISASFLRAVQAV